MKTGKGLALERLYWKAAAVFFVTALKVVQSAAVAAQEVAAFER